MNVLNAIKKRRSIRKYTKKPILEKDLRELLEVARLAPSGSNRQPWEIILVRDETRKKELVPLCKDQKFIADCSVLLVGVDNPEQKWQRVDLAIAFDHIALAAVEKGLGTCWIGAFDREAVARYLKVPEGKVVTACLTLGYPAEDPEPRHRKEMEDLFHWEEYGGTE
ncbi:MAG: nitroreductase [Methanomassiliicoccales archaeon]|nr:nitroreductase [Methanomassiliicoccales archaeon]NYT14344.1 nitroreductase [Methanomassiliicoccales archaeon]